MTQPDNESIQSILQRRVRARGWSSVALAAQVCWVADQLSAGRYRSLKFQNDTLVVKANNSILAHELRVDVPVLIEKIRQTLGWPPERTLKMRITLR